MRICLVYDCLFPWTVGGAERWYRSLAERLAAAGHQVTYLTRRQWEPGDEPRLPGVEVIAVSGRDELYTADGRRRIGPPLRFGAGVLRHLARHRRAYDVVHTCAFPYFSLLAARAALAGSPTRLGVDWFEVWSRGYWRDYLGGPGGWVGWAVQRACARLTPLAFVFSDVHARRLREEGVRGEVVRLSGLYDGAPGGGAHAAPGGAGAGAPDGPLAVFAGRHIPEKRAHLLPAAVAAARERVPGLRGLVLGDGPERPRVLDAIAEAGAREFVQAPGFVPAAEVEAAMARASCLVLPSVREGYGMVVIEAAAAGTPSVVCAAPDNAAVELVTEGENGAVAPDEGPAALADAIVRAVQGGEALRASTRRWYAANAERLSLRSSLDAVERAYAAPIAAR